jgi:hypothetical protein|tara:strand:+ start:317 stop:553 length:237 start_codon:yes stop_codon:yes gene_type:complete
MEKVMKYLTGFLGGLVSIMIAIVPVTILWTLLTGTSVFGMNIIANFMDLVNQLGANGFVGLLSLIFIMYFFLCEKCVK